MIAIFLSLIGLLIAIGLGYLVGKAIELSEENDDES